MPAPAVESLKPEEGPEEGEIVSEDDLEDISDSSMTFTSFGKSFSNSHHLTSLSLSSVTENELDDLTEEREKHQKRRRSRGHHSKRRKKLRRTAPNSDSSDDEILTPIDERLKLQLKAAVHVEVEEAHRNSLRTRLRAMVKDLEPENEQNSSTDAKDSLSVVDLVDQDDSSVIEVVPTGQSQINLSGVTNTLGGLGDDNIVENGKNEELDNELMQLRLEALKTAISNKFSKGRRRKRGTNEDKENTSSHNSLHNSDVLNEVVKVPEVSPQPSIDSENNAPQSPDEDEDVLRALLLASMSKKIMKEQSEVGNKTPTITQTKQEIIRQKNIFLNKINNFKLNNKVKKILANVKKPLNNVQKPTKLINMPQVKPLIITLDSDSDSDFDFSSSPEKPNKKSDENKLANLSEKPSEKPKESEQVKDLTKSEIFPKETIAKKPDEEIMTSVENFLKEQRAKVELELTKATTSITKKLEKQSQPNDLEKSALKYLSESKREEYRKLQHLLKMKMKNQKTRVRRISQKLNKSNNLQITVSQKNNHAQNFTLHKSIDIQEVTKPKQSANLKMTMPNLTMATSNFKANNIATCLSTTREAALQASKAFSSTALKPKTTTVAKLTQTEDFNEQLPKELHEKLHAFKLQELNALKRNKERKSGSALMRAKLRELQSKMDGRLQIQDKYKSLRPLVKKMIDLNKQQKQCDQEVERLMQQLTKARENQDNLHRSMSTAIVELIEEKKKIDVSHSKMKEPSLSTTLVTSTPIRSGKPLPFTPSSAKISIETKTNNSQMANTWEQSTLVCNNKVSFKDNATICQNDSTQELTVVDPNDIDNIIQETAARVAVLEKRDPTCEEIRLEKVRYVSPLDSAIRKSAIEDPFKIVCPFEVNGTCKDPDCNYNHFLK